jgi:hypothetical protein
MSFRYYLTDAVQLLTENTARFGGGASISKRWAEILDSRGRIEENRDPKEIIADIAQKAGLTIL